MLSRREVDSAELTWPLVMSKKKAAALVWQPIFSDGINESDWAQVMMRWDNSSVHFLNCSFRCCARIFRIQGFAQPTDPPFNLWSGVAGFT